MEYTPEELSFSCEEKVRQLMDKYFPDFIHEAAYVRPESLSEQYNNDLPRKIEEEYREWLRQKYKLIKKEGGHPFAHIINREGERGRVDNTYLNEYLPEAKRDAQIHSLWERITRTNHGDVTYYKDLLRIYSRELLESLTQDFLEDL